MTNYTLDLPDIGAVKVEKKRGMRSIRMRIDRQGKPVVSAPWHVPRPYINKFIVERKDWIIKNSEDGTPNYLDGTVIVGGIKIHLRGGFARNSVRLAPNDMYFRLNGDIKPLTKNQEKYIEKKILEVMTNIAEHELLPRLEELSRKSGIRFNQAFVKRLSSRWGSCDHNKNITLNIFLIQVPKPLQDYVMIHELSHVLHLNHGSDFWSTVEEMMPGYKSARKQLKNYKTRINTTMS